MATTTACADTQSPGRRPAPTCGSTPHNPGATGIPGAPRRSSARARRASRSCCRIGYSACHWCHVMAHESFEDAATAALMNELFVNIKVDREERPDLDRIYQLAQQLLTQRGGGWPLTMFLTPDDQRPFFGGTYFPPEPRYGMPAFKRPAERVAELLPRARAGAARSRTRRWCAALGELEPPPARRRRRARATRRSQLPRAARSAAFDASTAASAARRSSRIRRCIERLLRDWHASAPAATPDLHALYMATLTLTRMAEGGIYDQLGGGFCRYPSMRAGRSRTSRRCSTTTAQLLARLCRGGAAHRRSAVRATSRTRPPTGCCARCARRTAASTPAWTRTPRAHEGKLLCLGARGSARRADRGRIRGARAALRARPARQLRGPRLTT